MDLTDNQLTGRLIDNLFDLPLTDLAMAKNFFLDIHIPSKICNLNQTLKTFALDGLYSSEACVTRILGNNNNGPP
jgi:hypothetical protein